MYKILQLHTLMDNMDLPIINLFLIFAVFTTSSSGQQQLIQQYRFDYEWVDAAGGWMKYHRVPAQWEEARLRCHTEGAVLASPLNYQLKEAIVSFVKKHRDCDDHFSSIFSGVHCRFSKGDYTSVEGVPLLRLSIKWASGEPNNLNNEENCLEMLIDANHNGSMTDTNCDRVLPYVCYKKYRALTINECGTWDPGYIFEPRTGSCYKFHKTGLFWPEAFMTCIGEGGYLAVINNQAEANAIKDFIARYPESSLLSFNNVITYVGFHDWGHYTTNFMTIHGETLEATYNIWHASEPSNMTYPRSNDVGESCGSVYRDMGLNDNLCHVHGAFLCEKAPNSLL